MPRSEGGANIEIETYRGCNRVSLEQANVHEISSGASEHHLR